MTHDDVCGSIKEHHRPEALKMIDGISGPMITFQLGDLKMAGEQFLHYLRVKRMLTVKPIIGYRLLMVNRFNPLIKLLELLLEIGVPPSTSFKKLRRASFES